MKLEWSLGTVGNNSAIYFNGIGIINEYNSHKLVYFDMFVCLL